MLLLGEVNVRVKGLDEEQVAKLESLPCCGDVRVHEKDIKGDGVQGEVEYIYLPINPDVDDYQAFEQVLALLPHMGVEVVTVPQDEDDTTKWICVSSN